METSTIIILSASVVVFLLVCFIIKWFLSLRRVVKPSEVHVVRESKNTLIYGNLKSITTADGKVIEAEETSGNVYYEIPQWFPIWGVEVQILPLSNFSVDLHGYEAYDMDKLPFEVDITAFFRIADYRQAASRIEDSDTLQKHLTKIVQSAVRSILANDTLDQIMTKRSVYGEQFTNEVADHLKEWGVVPVKSIELMDVRDKDGERVISNIMEKKKSFIDKESRKEVAKNNQEAREAEILAEQEVALKEEAKEETVGKRRAEREKAVGIAKEQSAQDVKEQQRATKEKEMEVIKVANVRQAEIDRETITIKAEAEKEKARVNAEAKVVVAEEDKKAAEHRAEADFIVKTKEAEANLVADKKSAEGTEAKGRAEAEVKKSIGLAEVEPQISLAKEIGENTGYQEYLVRIETIKADQAVGVEQAKNLGNAQIKIIANAGGNVQEGVKSVSEIFSAKGGQSLGAMVEAFAATEVGQQVIGKLMGGKKEE
jgi:flotillin